MRGFYELLSIPFFLMLSLFAFGGRILLRRLSGDMKITKPNKVRQYNACILKNPNSFKDNCKIEQKRLVFIWFSSMSI